jgi:hypothetical protein
MIFKHFIVRLRRPPSIFTKSVFGRRRESPPPGDPYSERPVPVRRGPKGRNGAAVAELEEDSYQVYRPRSQ